MADSTGDSRVRTDSTAANHLLAVSADGATVLVKARVEHWPYIEALRMTEKPALGFIPKQRYLQILDPRYGSHRAQWNAIVLTFDNGDPTGFAYVGWGPNRASRSTAAIHQIVVQQDARRWSRAALMADWVCEVAAGRGRTKVTARVAVDLESNLYWSAMGFNIVGTTTSTFLQRQESKSGRQLHLYEKPITPTASFDFGAAS